MARTIAGRIVLAFVIARDPLSLAPSECATTGSRWFTLTHRIRCAPARSISSGKRATPPWEPGLGSLQAEASETRRVGERGVEMLPCPSRSGGFGRIQYQSDADQHDREQDHH